MNNSQKKKRNFRASKKWREFRHKMNVKQKGIDPITRKKLIKSCNLHHRNLSAEDYENLENESDFVLLNKQTHDTLHWIYRYWKTDPEILDRIEAELKAWHE